MSDDGSYASYERYNSPSDDDDVSPIRSTFSSFFGVVWSESLFLAVLFGAIAILLPALFYFISGGAVQDYKETISGDHGTAHASSTPTTSTPGTRPPQTPLSALNPYILSAVLRALASAIIILRPFRILLSFIWALLYPGFLVVHLLFRTMIVLPWRIFSGLVIYFYPAYVFGVVAVMLSAIVGLAGRVTVQGGRWWLASEASAGESRERHRSRLRFTDSRGKKLR